MIKVEKGVPIPKDGRGTRHIYPWAELEVGDSFLVKGVSRFSHALPKALHDAGWKITRRKVDGGVRVWRIK